MKQLDLLLINPGNRMAVYQSLGNSYCAIEPPTFTALVATYVRKNGYSVQMIDVPAETYTDDEIAMKVKELNPKLVGMFVYGYQPSASTQNMFSAGNICRAIKGLTPEIKIMISGTHPAALPELTLKSEAVDYVCDRDGFDTTVLLLDSLSGKLPITDVPSLWYYSGGLLNTIQHSAPVKLLKGMELDEMADMPAWDLLPMNRYRSHNWHSFDHIDKRSPYASLYTSLGCPYACSFCCINAPFGKSSYRMWSPEVTLKQIDVLVNKYGVKNIKFVDEMFVLNEDHVLGICDGLIERNYDLNIWAYARVDTVKDQFLEKLRKAGFRWLALGIESASKHVRDGANKIYTNDDIIEIVRKIQSHGSYVIGNYIFGLPDDTHESMQATLDLAKELNCEFSNFYSTMAYPGSKLYTLAIENGWELPSSWLGYSQHSYETTPLRTDELTNAEVLAFRDKAFIEYYKSDRYRQMILKKFGQAALNDVDGMLNFGLKRKILGE